LKKRYDYPIEAGTGNRREKGGGGVFICLSAF
jgi:hypothetical protein